MDLMMLISSRYQILEICNVGGDIFQNNKIKKVKMASVQLFSEATRLDSSSVLLRH